MHLSWSDPGLVNKDGTKIPHEKESLNLVKHWILEHLRKIAAP